MQPEQNPKDWKQPPEQSSQAPYAAIPTDTFTSEPPVVTLTPDEPVVEAIPYVKTSATLAQVPVQDDQTVEQPVRWKAKEYIQHDKTVVWFILFALVTLTLMAIAIFLMKSISFSILIPVMATALIVYINRPPRELNYTLSRKGLHINDHLYPFDEFKGFGIIHDGKEYSVMLLPVKRFKPGVSVYFPEAAGEAIVDMLGVRLPMQTIHLDFVDKIIRKIRL